MGVQAGSQAGGPAADAPTAALSEAVLESFDRAAQVTRFAEDLFDPRASGELAMRLEALVAALQDADVEMVAKHGQWRHRLFGADIEARLKFAVARRNCERALGEAKAAAGETARRIQQLEAALPVVQSDQRRLDSLDGKARDFAARLAQPESPAERELHARFERRRANLGQLRAANALTQSQIPVAVSHQRQVLDRFVDVETVLFPVWQRHCLALMEARGGEEQINAVRKSTRALIDRLMGKLEAAA